MEKRNTSQNTTDNQVRFGAWVTIQEKNKLENYIRAKHTSMVDWLREKISELPEYEVKYVVKNHKQKTG